MLGQLTTLALTGAARLPVFPENGLDRSLHAPVLVGLLVLSVCAETLGWTYAGLVVPGYLAAVFVAAPVTACLVLFEALATYWLTALVGLWIPKTGAWSSAFGRERFFLFIVGAVLVRLAVEGNLIPWLSQRMHFEHSQELYSLGLVLVPLLSNAFWNAGFLTALPRVAFVTGITFAIVKFVLLAYTNFTVSRFAIANEAVSLAFLESPHAHIILLIGALLGARNNVLYGWDYNGILVPGLLAVAWYQPSKLLTTMVEAIVVFWISLFITQRGPLKKLLIVGSRRMVVVFLVGFALKLLLGYVIASFAPRVQMVDYFGFGYLLPSLLAVKMWNKQKMGPVIMPTLQVSLLGFVAGNIVGYALTAFDARIASARPAQELRPEPGRHVAFELILGDTAKSPRDFRIGEGQENPAQIGLRAAREMSAGNISESTLDAAARAWLVLHRDARNPAWYSLTPRSVDPDDDRIAPRFAVRQTSVATRPWLIIADVDATGSSAPVVAFQVAETIGAQAIVLRSAQEKLRAYDEKFAESLAEQLDLREALLVHIGGGRATFSVVGRMPAGLNLTALGRAVGSELSLEFRAPTSGSFRLRNAASLALPEERADELSATVLSAPAAATWQSSVRRELTARIDELTRVSQRGYRAPTIEELRVMSAVVWPAVQRLATGSPPDAWKRAIAKQLSYEFAHAPAAGDAWVMFEPASADRHGNATLVIQPTKAPLQRGLAVEVPAALWERGTFAASLALADGLDAELLLLPGALPNSAPPGVADLRRPTGRRSYYNRIHEEWLAAAGHVIAVHGISPDRTVPEDAVVSFGREVIRADAGPEWSQPLARALADAGVRLGAFDGTIPHLAFEGSGDPPFEYARRFAADQMFLLWLGAPVRDRWVRLQEDVETEARVLRLLPRVPEVDVAERAVQLITCANADILPANSELAEACTAIRAVQHCELDPSEEPLLRYARTKNPYDLRAGIRESGGCYREVLRDRSSGFPWILLVERKQARLLPLSGGEARPAANARTLAEVRTAVALGLSSIRLEAP